MELGWLDNMLERFTKDVNDGLSGDPKSLPSKYFYDKIGDKLFVEIMHLKEYYLTRAELEIFETQPNKIIEALGLNPNTYFELIELGAGDGLKTKKLLETLVEQSYNFDYLPIDISLNSLQVLEQALTKELPQVSVKKLNGDYFDVLESIKNSHHPKVILFLGSNIGNLLDKEASEFIYKLGANLSSEDKLFLGVDLIKDESIILPAYNDSQGVTSAFNLNLLTRINNELGANFDIDCFKHFATYTRKEGVAKSFLVSTKAQEVTITKTGKKYSFKENEKIHTEISRKYNDKVIDKIIANTDFKVINKLTDDKNYFANYVLNRG